MRVFEGAKFWQTVAEAVVAQDVVIRKCFAESRWTDLKRELLFSLENFHYFPLNIPFCKVASKHWEGSSILLMIKSFFVDRDKSKTVEFFTNLAKVKSDPYSTIAIHIVGYCYQEGWGVKQNLETACVFFEEAMARGCFHACHQATVAYRARAMFREAAASALRYSFLCRTKNSPTATPTCECCELLQSADRNYCTPFGYWTTDPALQVLVSARVRKTQKQWMLIAKRLAICRDVASLVAMYVCTAPFPRD
jgi:TPR repeat protein